MKKIELTIIFFFSMGIAFGQSVVQLMTQMQDDISKAEFFEMNIQTEIFDGINDQNIERNKVLMKGGRGNLYVEEKEGISVYARDFLIDIRHIGETVFLREVDESDEVIEKLLAENAGLWVEKLNKYVQNHMQPIYSETYESRSFKYVSKDLNVISTTLAFGKKDNFLKSINTELSNGGYIFIEYEIELSQNMDSDLFRMNSYLKVNNDKVQGHGDFKNYKIVQIGE